MDDSAPSEADREIGARIRARRKELGLTQAALAEALGVAYQQLHRIERGRGRLTSKRMVRLSAALRMTPNQVLGVEAPPPAPDPEEGEELAATAGRLALLSPADRAVVARLVRALAPVELPEEGRPRRRRAAAPAAPAAPAPATPPSPPSRLAA